MFVWLRHFWVTGKLTWMFLLCNTSTHVTLFFFSFLLPQFFAAKEILIIGRDLMCFRYFSPSYAYFFFVRTARLEKLLIKREQAVFFPLDLCNTQVNREGVASCLLMFAIDFWNYYLRQSKRLIKATDRCPAHSPPRPCSRSFIFR